MTNKPQEQRIHEFELTVRTIDDMLPDLPTKSLQKWQAILHTSLIKINKELTNTYLHTCKICFFQEYGYRDELPASWYKKGGAEICFQHEYDKAEQLLKDAGYEEDASSETEIPAISVEALNVQMKNTPEPTEEENTLKELMDLL